MAEAALPVRLGFARRPPPGLAWAAPGLRPGWSEAGQQIPLPLAEGALAAGGRAMAALDPAAAGLALDLRGLGAGLALDVLSGAVLRAAEPAKPRPLRRRLVALADDPAALRAAWAARWPELRGNLLARRLVAAPANRLTPRAFVAALSGLRGHGLRVEVLDRAGIEQAGLGLIAAVGRAAASGPYLVTLALPPDPAGRAPIAFIGKGVCFDTGGICLKPAEGMETMRADMAGAAACAGAMLALALRGARGAVAVLPIVENAIGADAYRPGDVLASGSGRTVEVVDTDAEGRLILADAMHYARTRFAPRAIVDVATLTGSIVIALGRHHAGLFCNHAGLRAALLDAAARVGEALWPMPIGQSHREDLASEIADIKQCAPAGSGAWGGRLLPDACHAAAFLESFAGDLPWAHLDIAGVDLAPPEEEAGEEPHPLAAPGMPTGFGARLLAALDVSAAP
ncbi:MAG: M17 family metallopeptidase [Rhodovarius sp.]|nr:M17 family metallopeptidase [Rhodovarius sp.]